MGDIVIKAEGLGKKYVIGHQAENGRYVALRDVLTHNARKMWQTTKDLMRGAAIVQGDNLEEVWALRDVNFEIHQGSRRSWPRIESVGSRDRLSSRTHRPRKHFFERRDSGHDARGDQAEV